MFLVFGTILLQSYTSGMMGFHVFQGCALYLLYTVSDSLDYSEGIMLVILLIEAGLKFFKHVALVPDLYELRDYNIKGV